jgi:threonine synthase
VADVRLRCITCHSIRELGLMYECPRCGGILDAVYPDTPDEVAEKFLRAKRDNNSSIWRFRELLPVGPRAKIISLGEGNSPLIRADNLAKVMGLKSIYLKNETVLPTCSFKDRSVSVALTKSLEFGVDTVVSASTGNTGAAVAAYAARAGLTCVIIAPAQTPAAKLRQAMVYGARVIRVNGDFSTCYKLSREIAENNGWFNLTSTFLVPYMVEGNKTVAYEVFLQLEDVPDWIVVPVGAGPLLVGIYKGFKELFRSGMSEALPRMVGVQAEGCAPIVRAFESGAAAVQPWGAADTVASAIADPLTGYPGDGSYTLANIRDSQGVAIAVDDKAILEKMAQLARFEGVFVEPASAAALAAVERLWNTSLIKPDDKVVCILTGHGLKDTHALARVMEGPPVIDPDIKELDKILRRTTTL